MSVVMRMTRRQIGWFVAVVLVALAIAAALRPSAVEVDTAVVTRTTLRVSVDEEGETRLRRRFVVSAPVGGRVLRIEARPGERVVAGQALAAITPARPAPLDDRTRAAADARARAADADLDRARSEWRRLVVEADQATRESARSRTLFSGGSVARDAAEAAEARARSANEAVKASEAAIRVAEFAAAEARAALISEDDRGAHPSVHVRSPIDGVVLKRLQESETIVAPGAPLLEIGDLGDLEIVTDVLSADAVRVRPGARVVITGWGGGRDLSGRVLRVEPSGVTKISALGVEEQRVNIVVEFVDPPAVRETLGDGFRVEVRVILSERPGVLVVPTAALFRTDRQWAVFLVTNGRVSRRTVQVGDQNEQSAEVLGGLAEGDVVVVYPGESLTEGAKVTMP